MAHAPTREPSGLPRSRKLGASILLQLIAMVGIGALVYPLAADWFSTLQHDGERVGYVRELEQTESAEIEAAKAAAREYNSNLPTGQIVDPYSDAAAESSLAADEQYQAYEGLLRLGEQTAIGEVIYPELGLGLPLYPGTGDSAISRGAGHLYGTSLPVGGDSTHAVLTSHSGLVNASLFTPLLGAEVGQVFELRVLGETLYYQVDRLETVEPSMTESLGVVEGEDRVTLFTCTPIGVNSHRFLVSGVRVPPPVGAEDSPDGGEVGPGFPWWAVGFIAGSAVVGYVLFVPRKQRRRDLVTV